MAGLGLLTAMWKPQQDPLVPRAESARYCPKSVTCSRRGTDDPDPERGPVSLPAGGHLDADRHQLSGVSIPGQPGSRWACALAPTRADSRAFRGSPICGPYR